MNLVFLSEAKDELIDAIEYYETKQEGLGIRFNTEVDFHLIWILQNPATPRLRKNAYRRVNLKVFKHYIAYIIRENRIWILAIAHGRTKPEYWIERIKNPKS
jgi:plasmid stabilization system protein ParE